MTSFTIAYIAVCFIWLTMELWLLIFRRSPGRDKDRKTLPLIWMAIFIGIFLANFTGFGLMARFPKWLLILRWPGIGLMIFGIVIRAMAIIILGESFKVDVSTSEDQELVTTGIYRMIRHPSYLGSLVACTGMGLALASWSSLSILIIPVSLAYHFRMNIEERTMLDRFGEKYSEYMKKSYRIIPYIY